MTQHGEFGDHDPPGDLENLETMTQHGEFGDHDPHGDLENLETMTQHGEFGDHDPDGLENIHDQPHSPPGNHGTFLYFATSLRCQTTKSATPMRDMHMSSS